MKIERVDFFDFSDLIDHRVFRSILNECCLKGLKEPCLPEEGAYSEGTRKGLWMKYFLTMMMRARGKSENSKIAGDQTGNLTLELLTNTENSKLAEENPDQSVFEIQRNMRMLLPATSD